MCACPCFLDSITQLTVHTLKLAHCIKQNGQEKSSVTAFEERQDTYQPISLVKISLVQIIRRFYSGLENSQL